MNYVYLNVRWTRWFAGRLMMVMVMIKGTFVLIHIMQIMERINYYCHFFSLHSTLDQQQSRKGSKKVTLKFLHSVCAKTKTFIQIIIITLSYSDKQKYFQMYPLVVCEGTIIIILQ